jgi:hypothetical protein
VGGFFGPVPDGMWAALRDKFGLPSLEQAQARLGALPDPEAALRSLVRADHRRRDILPRLPVPAGRPPRPPRHHSVPDGAEREGTAQLLRACG